jgi:hypothetical protein
MKFVYYTDPGHGWVKVSRQLLLKYNIADKISCFSYQRGNTVYLEEDCDLGHLDSALTEQGIKIDLINRHTNRSSKIRNYQHYSLDK